MEVTYFKRALLIIYLICRADTVAKSLKFQYDKDLEIYKKVKETQGLSNEALISYIGIRAISNAKTDVNLAMQSPARTSYTSITE